MGAAGTEIRCGQCGELNPLTSLHCRKCGAKIDFEAAERVVLKQMGRRKGRWHRRISAVLFWALFAALVLVLWPAGLERDTGDATDAKRYRMKVELLLDSLNRGQPGGQDIAEREVNSWLARQLAKQSVEEDGIKEAAVKFEPGKATGFFLAERWGFFRFSVTYTARAEDGRLVLSGLRVGHLPLPAALAARLPVGPERLSEAFEREARVLGNTEAVLLEAGVMRVLTKAE